jgi:NAD(P)-dependent dehydrogenase (short-subunit alcohol dehydrogenase family)
MLTKVLAIELTPLGITVNAIAPGLIAVPDADLTDEYRDTLLRGIPAGRIGVPADIARTAVYLAEPGSDFISGSVFFIDGGSSAGRTHLPFSSKAKQALQS